MSYAPADREDELLDLVDGQNRVIGVVRRGDCHGDPTRRHRAVHVFVVNARGDMLLQKRARTKRIQPGRWDTSVGGHVCHGETYEQAAVKEIEEELGICIGDARALTWRHDHVWRSAVETEHVRTFMLAHEGPFSFQASEIEEGRFWSVRDIVSAMKTGVLTPNLEQEMVNLGLA
jgi:isopentenyl-diphosphate delta-isomerase type 1